MKNNDANDERKQGEETPKSVLEEIIREGARQLLQTAVEHEVAEYIDRFSHLTDTNGHRMVVRNGFSPERNLITGIGPVSISQPRIKDRRPHEAFTSSILPRYMRRVPSIDRCVPILYLKGISTGDMMYALESILGPNASGLSATNIVRLKRLWESEYRDWAKRDFSEKRYVYFWADGIYFNIRLEEPDTNKMCFLIIMGAREDGKKELVAILDGYRESKSSWMEVLLDIKKRGLTEGPRLAVGDGNLGFWAAIEEVYPACRHQRCWVHKTVNVLDKMPSSVHAKAKEKIHDMYLAPSKEQAFVAYNSFFTLYQVKFPQACECLKKDKENLFTFYDFPAEHWIHIRTTNPIESTFATVRHRTKRTKGMGTRLATLTMVFKLVKETERTWKKIKGYILIPKVLKGIRFINGEQTETAEQVA
ncbi:MAG: Transposase, Mutator family [Syntrophorhabdus sp. PtaB.Bin006]|nr:MAG: Transposase, Mutator family [Syntrophorhabdus sp. PtaB.Bin006]